MNKKFLSKNQSYIPGIYGGMGPAAHIYFEKLLIEEAQKKGAQKDQDYPFWLVINASSTPDRTESLLGGRNALKHLIYYCRFLEKSGADFIIMTCNTAHAYTKEIQKSLHIPLISLIDVTIASIKTKSDEGKKIGILATTGTLTAKVYQNALEENNLQPVFPEPNSFCQNNIMDAIYNPQWGIKATGSRVNKKAVSSLLSGVKWCKKQGADIIIMGCTEISVALEGIELENTVFIDPLKIVSQVTLQLVYNTSSISSKNDDNREMRYQDENYNLSFMQDFQEIK